MILERSLVLESDVAMIQMQGLEPVPEFFSIAERYVAGELTLDQFSAEVDRLSSPEGAAARKRRQGQRTPLISLFRSRPWAAQAGQLRSLGTGRVLSPGAA
jgi:Antitoxin VbhA